jgi:hypothetical protein
MVDNFEQDLMHMTWVVGAARLIIDRVFSPT